MTTEDDFQRALDANPDDHHTRLVFADWLQERDDPRAEGYRALEVLGKIPDKDEGLPGSIYAQPKMWVWGKIRQQNKSPDRLPDDWHTLILNQAEELGFRGTDSDNWKKHPTRRHAEDAVALAFARLPEARRAELLSEAVAA